MKNIFAAIIYLVFFTGAGKAQHPAEGGQPVVHNLIQDNYMPSARVKLSGLLNSRIIVNQEKRLLQVDTALLLSGFEHRPGSQAWIGEHIGKFLFAAVNSYRYAPDQKLKSMMDEMVKKYISTQLPDGYLGTYLPENYWSEWDVWAHKYAIIGLLSYYSLTKYEPALTSARRAGDLVCRTFGNGTGQLDLNKSGHHAGMAAGSILEAIIDLYRYTNDHKYLEFAKYILANWESPTGPKIISGLEAYAEVTKVGNAKAYEMMSCFLGILKYYKLTGDARYLRAMQAAWQDIASRRLYITGTSSANERFQSDNELPAAIKDKMGEGCVTTTWIQFSSQLLDITGEMKYAEEMEKAVYNHLLGAENAVNGCVSYYTPLQGAKPQNCRLTCCLSSVPRAISMIPEMIYGRIDKEFAVLFYEAGEVQDSLTGAGGGKFLLRMKATSDFPSSGNVVYKVLATKKEQYAMHFRVPSWSTNYTVDVNGEKQSVAAGSALRIERVWKPADVITIRFEMPLQVLPGGISYPGQVAFKRGPQVLAVDSMLNTGFNQVSLAGETSLYKITPNNRKLPKGWVGNQCYVLSATSAGASNGLVLVPFGDSGQQGTEQRVWVPATGRPTVSR